jgi:hypothetical protein
MTDTCRWVAMLTQFRLRLAPCSARQNIGIKWLSRFSGHSDTVIVVQTVPGGGRQMYENSYL